MKLMFRFKKIRGSYFYKIFMFFIIIIALISSISFVYYYNLRNNLMEDVAYENKNRVNNIAAMVQKELEEVEKTCSLMALDIEQVLNARARLGYNEFIKAEYKNITKMYERLNRQDNIKQSIGNTAIHFVLNDCVLTKEGTFYFYDYFNIYNKHLNFDAEMLKESDNSAAYINVLGLYEVEKLEITKRVRTAVVPIIFSYISYKNLYVNIIIDLKEEYLQNMLINNKYSDGTQFVIADKEGKIISSTSSNFNKSIRALLHKEESIGNGGAITLADSTYFTFKNKIGFANWTVFSFVPERDFMEKARNVLGIIFLTNVVLLLTGFIMAFYFSERLYSPIANLVKLLTDTPIQEHKSRNINDIELIYGKLDFLKKTNRELSGRISKYGAFVQENFVRNIILYKDSAIEESEIMELFKMERVTLNWKYFLLVSFKLSYSPEFASDFIKEEQDKVKNGIGLVIRESVLQRFEESLYIELSQDNFLIMVNTNDEDIQLQVCSFVEKLNEIFKEDAKYIKMFVYIGDKVTSLLYLHEDYKKFRNIMDNSDTLNATCILKEENCINDIEVELPQNFENRLSNLIESSNYSDIQILLIDTFDTCFKKCRTVSGLKKISDLLEDLYKKESLMHNFNYNDENMQEVKKAIEEWNFEGVCSEYASLFIEIAESVSGQYQGAGSDSADKRKRKLFEEYFMNSYCNENTSLESMAGELNFSTNYLSKKVKEIMGKPFSEYLASLRMEKAMELLENSEMPVDSIVKNVGMNSRATFNRQFKKHTCVSPAVFRAIKRK